MKDPMNPSERIDELIAKLTDWRGKTVASIRKSLLEADREIIEEWKWMGSLVWSHDGIIEMYRIQYGVTEYHANCYDNPRSAFRELGIEPEPLPSSLNFFMNADVEADGRLSFLPPRTRAGAA
jgi:hypothetical protein